MQSIQTKYIGPTNHRGSRVKATAQAGSITISWDNALDIDANHDAAAIALVKKFGWDHRDRVLARGGRVDGCGNVYCFTDSTVPVPKRGEG